MSFEIKERDNGVFFLEYRDENGKRIRRSLKTKNRRHADKLGRDLYIQLNTGQDGIDTPTKAAARRSGSTVFTLGDAIDRMQRGKWSPDNSTSWVTIWSDCRIIKAHFGDVELTAIQATDIQAFADKCKAEGLKPGTIKKRLSRLRTMMNKAATAWINPETQRPYLSYVPEFPENVGMPKPRKRELTEADERAVLEYCDQQRTASNRGHQWWLFKQFIVWQIDTGMRKGETLGKTLADIKGDSVMLYDGETKNGEGREIPLTSRLQKMVAVFRGMEITGPIFEGLNEGKVFEMWAEVRAELGLGDIVIHDLRHTRGQRLADAGVPIEVIADLLGHKDISVTARVYTFRKGETLRKWTDFAEQAQLRAVEG
jgi:integrase